MIYRQAFVITVYLKQEIRKATAHYVEGEVLSSTKPKWLGAVSSVCPGTSMMERANAPTAMINHQQAFLCAPGGPILRPSCFDAAELLADQPGQITKAQGSKKQNSGLDFH